MEVSIIDYTCNVEELKGVSRKRVEATLADVGFSPEGQAAPIASLSGGWKMKLALARAMLQEAQVINATKIVSIITHPSQACLYLSLQTSNLPSS